jgi:hypothetical protein
MRFGFIAHPGFKSPSLRQQPSGVAAALRLSQVDDLLAIDLVIGTRVRQHPAPTLFGVREMLDRATFTAGEPITRGDRYDVDHIHQN